MLWGCTVLMGFLISYLSAHRTLVRVQQITATVARIGSEDMGERLPRPVNSDEISRLAETFNNMLDRIQISVNELRSVTDSVAHDLKSPITSIRGALESSLTQGRDDQWRDSVGEAIEGLDRLLNALDTTLDVAEAQAGALRLDRRAVNLSAMLKQLVELYHPSIDERRHRLESDVEDHIVVDADRGLMNRVLSNLIENEIAHLPEGCRIAIRLRFDKGLAQLVIEDNGPGFPAEIGGRAFERFVRGKHSRGHGLGLAFVDAIVRAHTGTATISGGPTGGAVVTLSLPATIVNSA
jgi:signal transduction histidine kinase